MKYQQPHEKQLDHIMPLRFIQYWRARSLLNQISPLPPTSRLCPGLRDSQAYEIKTPPGRIVAIVDLGRRCEGVCLRPLSPGVGDRAPSVPWGARPVEAWRGIDKEPPASGSQAIDGWTLIEAYFPAPCGGKGTMVFQGQLSKLLPSRLVLLKPEFQHYLPQSKTSLASSIRKLPFRRP